MSLDEEEALLILKESYARYCIKYPKLILRFNDYINEHPHKGIALASLLEKLIELDQWIEWKFQDNISN
jgi:hypothetical protein